MKEIVRRNPGEKKTPVAARQITVEEVIILSALHPREEKHKLPQEQSSLRKFIFMKTKRRNPGQEKDKLPRDSSPSRKFFSMNKIVHRKPGEDKDQSCSWQRSCSHLLRLSQPFHFTTQAKIKCCCHRTNSDRGGRSRPGKLCPTTQEKGKCCCRKTNYDRGGRSR